MIINRLSPVDEAMFLVVEAMWYMLRRMCFVGCKGYVLLVRLCGRLRRICVGLAENKANSALKLVYNIIQHTKLRSSSICIKVDVS